MIIIVYSQTNSVTVKERFGESEYSYYFVLKEFLPLLQEIGTVFVVNDPAREVDVIYHRAVQNGESCVFLSFSPPHWTPLDLACPTIPVFAWEFDSIPSETWFGERFQDWRFVLNKCGRAITHSNFAVRAVQEAMGQDFPIMSIPAPVWNRFSALRQLSDVNPIVHDARLNIDAAVIDSHAIDWAAYSAQGRSDSDIVKLPKEDIGRETPTQLQIDGVIYTSILSSYDGRKNYFDMIDAFCWVLREAEDATLILKLGHKDSSRAVDRIMGRLYKLAPFKCRVVLIDGYINDENYKRLLRSTTYAVNTSIGEGQCLPLMEYMSYGIPAIAPHHTAMVEYISADNAFIVDSTTALTTWPHDPRSAYRTLTRRIDFESLLSAYRESYRVAKEAPGHYRVMSENARHTLKRHCSADITLDRLRAFIAMAPKSALCDHNYGRLVPRNIVFSLDSTVDFARDPNSCRYLTTGWSITEFDNGVWSDEAVAQLAFRIEPKPTGSLLLSANVSAFVNAAHTDLTIDVFANGIPVALWEFSYARPEEISRSWRKIIIEADIVSNDEICIELHINHPASPKQLGLSIDPRLLGVMLHELSISSLDEKYAELEQVLAECEDKIASLDGALDDRARELGELKDVLAEREASVVKSERMLADRDRELGEIRNVLTEREADVVKYARTLAEREAKIVVLDGMLADRDRDLEALRDVMAKREEDVAELKTTIAALRSSTSWRLTAPLRWVRKMLGRLRYSSAGYIFELGWQALRARSLVPMREWRAARIIARSNLFDRTWYLQTNLDVAELHIDPVRHYVTFGAREGRDPSPLFKTQGYFACNPDVSSAGLNPLLHFILHGAAEGRNDGSGGKLPSALRMTRRGWMGRLAYNIAGALALLRKAIRLTGGVVPLAMKSWRVLCSEGFGGVRYRIYSLQQLRVPTIESSNRTRADGIISIRPSNIPEIVIPDALAKAQRWCTSDNPTVSILIINWNATQLTLECVRQIWANTEGVTYEIIIADNGSDPQSVTPLKKLGSGTRLLELGVNRFFGEANNIAAEQAAGKYICLVNNDAFVRPGWLYLLLDELEKNPEVGAVGPMFLFSDNTLQEAGCAIDEYGYPMRFGRNLDPELPEFNVPKYVDYVSAATLLMERKLFIEAGGFELAYEPAYYEDSDLCFKLLAMGRKTRYCPAAKVIHVEGASANDDVAAQSRRKALGDLNRDKFIGRWGDYLKTRSEQSLRQLSRRIPSARKQKENDSTLPMETTRSAAGSLAIYTPFALTPGGGERYILTLAASLADNRKVTIVTSHPYSQIRLRSLGRDFDLDLSQCELMTYERFIRGQRPDFMFTLGNYIVPTVPAHAANSWYHCQFPFPIEAKALEQYRDWLAAYRGIIVNSTFTKDHALRALEAHKLPSLPIEVIHPPVPTINGAAARKKNIILSVGRFFVGGHSKRQDLMITAFCDIIRSFSGEIELHLAGSSIPEALHMAYLSELQKTAQHLPVKFHVNPTQEVLSDLYRDAAMYWHGTGLQCDLNREPEKAEHFGITIVEAMSAECVPLAFNAGGPREIISHGVDGYLYNTMGSLVELTLDLLHRNNAARRIEMGRAAGLAARRYTVERFASNVRRLVET